MSNLKYVKTEKLSLKNHPEFNEKWLQSIIADDPSILGLGDLVLKDMERPQPRAGRLDLLLQDPDSSRRYEVEIQLGSTDESHIIRTIEYWDIERKRYPQYDHTAVIVAEDVTSRFLNVISLFNGFIPLVAIQMNALRHGDEVSLACTTVLDQMTLGLIEEDEEKEVADRSYWEKKGTKATIRSADTLLSYIHQFDQNIEPKYNKFYIGVTKNGQPSNFVTFRPQKSALLLDLKLPKSDDIEDIINNAGLDLVNYMKWGKYRIRLVKDDVKKHKELLTDLMHQAHDNMLGG